MTVGFCGLGKLGLPVALAVESKGHKVLGHDINADVAQYLVDKKIPFQEEGIQPLLDKTKLEMVSFADLVEQCEIIFVAIQTPHEYKFEGSTRLPDERADFDYRHLISGLSTIFNLAKKQESKTTVVTISTCLPGTFKREIEPLLNPYVNYVYNPFFIAMGTVLHDFLNPEFVLLGEYQPVDEALVELYQSLHDKPFMITDITTAEAIKVSYNTFITTKTVLANLWGEIAHKIGANVDDIYEAWSLSTDRLISPKYLKAGVGDGGGCHPRDNIALSWLAKEIDLSHNFFEDIMKAREDHMDWLANMVVDAHKRTGKQIMILGKSFKPETNIETGSPAILLQNLLRERQLAPVQYDPHIDKTNPDDGEAKIYILATKHPEFQTYPYPEGSIVLDPFRIVSAKSGVIVVKIGS